MLQCRSHNLIGLYGNQIYHSVLCPGLLLPKHLSDDLLINSLMNRSIFWLIINVFFYSWDQLGPFSFIFSNSSLKGQAIKLKTVKYQSPQKLGGPVWLKALLVMILSRFFFQSQAGLWAFPSQVAPVSDLALLLSLCLKNRADIWLLAVLTSPSASFSRRFLTFCLIAFHRVWPLYFFS